MDFISAAFPKRPIRVVRHGISSLATYLIYTLLSVVPLVGCAIWLGPGLVRDVVISTNPVEVPDALVENAKCSTDRGFFTDCSADLTYEVKGKQITTSVSYLFLGAVQDDEVTVERSAAHPTLATLNLGLDKLWDRIVVAVIIAAIFLIGSIIMIFATLRASRLRRKLDDPVELVPLPVELTSSRVRLVNYFGTMVGFRYSPDGKRKHNATHSFGRDESPLVMNLSGVSMALAAMPKGGGQPLLLDADLKRIDITETERQAILAAIRQSPRTAF